MGGLLPMHPLFEQFHAQHAARLESEISEALRNTVRQRLLDTLSRRPHYHTELIGLVRARVYGSFTGPFHDKAAREIEEQKALVASVLRTMCAEGEIDETSTLAVTLYSLPKAAP